MKRTMFSALFIGAMLCCSLGSSAETINGGISSPKDSVKVTKPASGIDDGKDNTDGRKGKKDDGKENIDGKKVKDDGKENTDGRKVKDDGKENKLSVGMAGKKKNGIADEFSFSDQYLDTVNITKAAVMNDYSMIGIQYGYTGSQVYWNPPSYKQQLAYRPINAGVTFTKYGKMFGYMPYFGFQIGLFYAQEGYKFKEDKETGIIPTMKGSGEYEAVIDQVEVPFLAHCHADVGNFKLLANLGIFGGYRLSIERSGMYTIPDYKEKFMDYNRRWDYGIKGGAGIGIVFAPLELHLEFTYKQSLSSLYDADYVSPYYYRYAYPMNFIVSAGIHYHITKRYGKTHKMLKTQARDIVFGEE